MKIVFATNNQHKLSEIRSILGDTIEVLSLKDIGCEADIPETGKSLEENALQKAQYVYDNYHIDCFADDTGLEVDALDGAPGVYSARYASMAGDSSSVSHDSEANMTRLLKELEDCDNRRARFRTVIALIQKKNICPCGCNSIKQIHKFEGIVEGQIIRERRGGEGFGYDPIFQPDGYDQTFAELGMEIKNHISHRARATQKLCQFLLQAMTLLLCLFSFSPLQAQVGTWKNHLAYSEVQNICEAEQYLFVLASNDLYQYNQNDQSITTYDKTNGLSDTNITHIAWNPQVKRLIAVYQNSNIDLIDLSGNIINISALYNKTMTEDKTVNKITIDGIYAWLHCDFGYLKVNMQRAEIADTYTENHPEYPTSLPAYDETKDLSKYKVLVSTLSPGGPKYNIFYEMKFVNGKLYTTAGQYSSYAQKNLPGRIQVFDLQDWQTYQENLSSITGYDYRDMDCIDVDPLDNSHVFAGGRTGLYEFRNGQMVAYYNEDNSPLVSAYSHGKYLGNEYVVVKGIKFDASGNLWIINNHSDKSSLFKLTADKKWEDLDNHLLYDSNAGISMHSMRQMMIDSRGLLWWVNDHWYAPSVICYDMDNEKAVVYQSFTNQDGKTISLTAVKCITEDLNGNMWIGTNVGPFYIEANEIGNLSVTLQQVKVPRNDGTDYADYLLSGVDITSIAIDPGGRKWFGSSSNGAYLISADNMTQLQHFTKDNSKLLSDIISDIKINSKTGEVFFATENGLCSYISDATETSESMNSDDVYAYPNPVTPDYEGLITIVGLTLNADVKITASNGALIAEGRSNGGMFTWDGCDKQGRRVASGVYMVITATSDGKSGTVSKIAVIR